MRWCIAVLLLVVPAVVIAAQVDAAKGRDDFVKYRCNVCHSLAGQKPAASIPLRDLSREKPEAVASLIVERTHLAPEALFDEMAMSSAASQLNQGELMSIVAYLRTPSAAAQKRQSKHR